MAQTSPFITSAQRRTLTTIQRLTEACGYAPTVGELAAELSLSKATVHAHLDKLIDKGVLRRTLGKARSLEIVRNDLATVIGLVAVPLLGNVAAGIPIEAIENADESILVEANLVGQRVIKHMQKNQRGTIADLPVVDGEPQLSKAVKATKRHDTTRPTIPKLLGHDFVLKKEQIEFMRILDEIWNGVIPLIEFERGLFEFKPLAYALLDMASWYEEGKIHEALTADMVRSKSEVIIANMLFERGIRFKYEEKLAASDGTFYLPDFTILWNGEHWYWEHWGRMDEEKYRNHRAEKVAWYKKNFPDRLVETFEGKTLSADANELIKTHFG